MSAACPSCKGSGELLRGTGIYDCSAPSCTAAVDRTALEDSLPAAALGHPLDTLWIGYQAGVAAMLAQSPVAYAVTAERGGIHKLAITKASAERKAARWAEEWPNNNCRVRPLIFGDDTANLEKK